MVVGGWVSGWVGWVGLSRLSLLVPVQPSTPSGDRSGRALVFVYPLAVFSDWLLFSSTLCALVCR